MISRDLTLTINDTSVSLDRTIILYRYDRGITLNIKLKSTATVYNIGTEITKARAIILRPNKKLSATPIENIICIENDKTKDKDYVFVLYLDDTYTDHLGEVGTYQIQLQLYSDKPNDECITIAPFTFEVKNPIGIPKDSAAYVDHATTDNYAVSYATNLPTGDLENGEYLETSWIGGDLITSGKLNKIEDTLDFVVDKLSTRISSTTAQLMVSNKADKNHTHDEYISSNNFSRIEIVDVIPDQEDPTVLYLIKK
jgi:hypothetical protein